MHHHVTLSISLRTLRGGCDFVVYVRVGYRFFREAGAGSVQLAALGAWLAERGVTLWDLGMMLDYKGKIGATVRGSQESRGGCGRYFKLTWNG